MFHRPRHLLIGACAIWLVSLSLNPGAAREQAPDRVSTRPLKLDLSLFAHGQDCQACHNNLASPSGEDVSIGTAWRATMMANSSRDPYWQASVRRETIDRPSHAADIQDECGGCHMPMSTHIARAAGRTGEVFARLPIAGSDGDPLDRLAADGVSCTACHQITPEGLGTRERFNGRLAVPPPPRDGVRRVYGPFEVDRGRKTIM